MQIDVARAIEEVLNQRKAVNIQGLGSLILEDTPAAISEDNKQIAPPSTQLRFYETETKNAPLRKHLMFKYNLTKDGAQKVIKKFSQSTVNTILNYKEVNIKGVTRIKKKGIGYELKPKKSFINKYYGALPVLDLPSSKKWDQSTKKSKEKSTTVPLSSSTSEKPEVAKTSLSESTNKPKDSSNNDKTQLKSAAPIVASSITKPKESSQKEKSTVSNLKSKETIQPKAFSPSVTDKPAATSKPISTITEKPKAATPITTPTTPATKPIVESISKPASPPAVPPKPVAVQPAKKAAVTPPAIPPKQVVQPTKKAIVTPPPVSAKPIETPKPKPVQPTTVESLKSKHAFKSSSPTENKVMTAPKKTGLTLNEKLGLGTAGSAAQKIVTTATSTVGSTSSQTSKAIKESFKLDSSLTKPASTPPPPPVYHDEGIGCVGPLLGLLGLLLMFLLFYLGYKKFIKKPQVDSISPTELVDDSNNNGDAQEETTLSDLDSGDNTGEAVSVEPKTCIIITGVFSRNENIGKMASRLENRGYEVYMEEYGPYTRVGFEYDCSDTDLASYLQNIRATIPYAQKAWYLEPDFYVEY